MTESNKYNEWINSLSVGDQVKFYSGRRAKKHTLVTVLSIHNDRLELSNGKYFERRSSIMRNWSIKPCTS